MPEITESTSEPTAPSRRIYFFVSNSQERFSPEFLISWTNMMSFCVNSGIEPHLKFLNTTHIQFNSDSNTNLLSIALPGTNKFTAQGVGKEMPEGTKYFDYFMWLDANIGFNVDHFIALLKYLELNPSVDVVSIPHTITQVDKDVKLVDVIMKTDKTSDGPTSPNEIFDYMTLESVNKMAKDGIESISARYTSLRFTLTRTSLFDKIGYPWFMPLTMLIDTTDSEGKSKQTVSESLNEIHGFCKNCMNNNCSIEVLTGFRVGYQTTTYN